MHIEVSWRTLQPVLREARRRGIALTPLADGTGYTIDELSTKAGGVSWEGYRRFMANVARFLTDDDFVELGGRVFRSPYLRPFALVARLLFNARDFYRWVNDPEQGLGVQHFTCVRPEYEEIGANRIQLSLHMAPGFEPCREFLLITKGGLTEMPRLVGLDSSHVDWTMDGSTAIYVISYPPGGGALWWLRRAVGRAFAAIAAGQELKRAHDALHERYLQLSRAQTLLQEQATQLQVAHRITEVVHANLDLQPTLDAITHSLVEFAQVSRASLVISEEHEGRSLDLRSSAGEPSELEPALSMPIVIRKACVGKIDVWLAPGAPRPKVERVMQYAMPSISVAIDDALTVTTLREYRHTLEEKVIERTRELASARDSLAETVRRLEEAQAFKDRIFANINHEIRTPLSLVVLSTAELRRHHGEALGEPSKRALAIIDASVERLIGIVDGMLLLAAGQEGRLKIEPVRCDVATSLMEIVASWTPSAAESCLTLTYEGPQRCHAVVDPAALERIVSNLLSNAIKFTPDGGSIEVRLTSSDDSVRVDVRDTGLGIEAELMPRVFERFEQGRTAARHGARGSGIGLSIVKELAEAHGGSVGVEPNRGGGTVFSVTLPNEPVVREVRGGAGRSVTLSRSRTSARSFGIGRPLYAAAPMPGRRQSPEAVVLIAEDDDDLRFSIAELLRSAHFHVLTAPDGLAALRLAKEHLPDILIADVGMPGMDGLELSRRFRALTGNRLAPVILLTAYAGIGDRLSGFEAGAIDYVVKPFEPLELLARVRAQLELRQMVLKLSESEKLASLGVLSAGLAHEMRNPANALVNAIEPLRQHLPPELTNPDSDSGQLLDIIEQCAAQLGRLARQLLGFARPGELATSREPLERMLRLTRAMLEPQLRSTRLIEELDYGGELVCAAPLIVQVLVNLVENAIHAAGVGGWVKLQTRLDGEVIVIEVSDSGPGVAPELRERIFEPFFSTKPPGAGTGLGLTTSRKIVERHGGSLRVIEGAAGSIFRITLPAEGSRNISLADTTAIPHPSQQVVQ